MFIFVNIFQGNSNALPFCSHRIFQKYDLYRKFHINTETMYNFTLDIAQGYPKQNPYHN